jgi:hypothetical protein
VAARGASVRPQLPQNFAPATLTDPQSGHG